MNNNRAEFAHALRQGKTVWAAGVYDALSAKLAEAAGFPALMTSGFAVSASLLGQPDVEVYTMTENLSVARNVSNAVSIPVVADTDTGYGNAINVMRTVREFEQAGLNAVIFEDQEVPKRCPAAAASIEILPVMESAAKIRAAVRARLDPNLIIVARTDALTEADAIERAKIYVEAGADLIQPISRCIPQFRCHLMTDAFAFIHRNLSLRAPISGVLVQLFFLRRHCRNHVIDKQSIPTGIFDTCESKLIFHLLKDDIGISRKVIGHDKVGLCLYVVPCVHAGLATGTGQYFFCDGRTQNKALKAISTNTRCAMCLAI